MKKKINNILAVCLIVLSVTAVFEKVVCPPCQIVVCVRAGCAIFEKQEHPIIRILPYHIRF